jgi:hypothetical protein
MLGLFLESLRNWQLLKKGSDRWVSECSIYFGYSLMFQTVLSVFVCFILCCLYFRLFPNLFILIWFNLVELLTVMNYLISSVCSLCYLILLSKIHIHVEKFIVLLHHKIPFLSLFCKLPTPEFISNSSQKSKWKLFYDWRSIGQSFLVSVTHLGLTTRILLLSDICGFVDVGRSL